MTFTQVTEVEEFDVSVLCEKDKRNLIIVTVLPSILIVCDNTSAPYGQKYVDTYN